MKRLPDVHKEDISSLVSELKDVIATWVMRNGVSGGSHAGSYNLYEAVENAVLQEYFVARATKKNPCGVSSTCGHSDIQLCVDWQGQVVCVSCLRSKFWDQVSTGELDLLG